MINIIGDGPLKNKYINYCKENNINNIEFYESISKNEIPAILKELDSLVITIKKSNLYKYEISPNKLFEYLASSKLIILSGNVYNNIVKISNCGIFVEAENKEKLKEVFLKMYYFSQSEREGLGQNGRKYLEKNFTNKVLASKLVKILDGDNL